MKDKGLRPWLAVIAGGESLVSHAGATLLVETARRSGLAGQLSRRLGPWRLPLATHDPGKIVLACASGLSNTAVAAQLRVNLSGTRRRLHRQRSVGVNAGRSGSPIRPAK